MDRLFQNLTLPDIWQQEAVRALRAGKDVVVHAPTGAGKTFIFELFYPQLRGQAVFTVPTRALANDKLAEWEGRGWDVGIATGDIARDLGAKVVVATLETQKARFLRREGPSLLVIDEYQMIADPVRGVNYELAVALAPAGTQLLLLSGSVGNPQDVVAWLKRLGRRADLVATHERPVPLEEVDLGDIPDRATSAVKGWWPRRIANALRADLGPVLLFAPRRQAAEDLAQQLATALPPAEPLRLTQTQEQLAGTQLAKLLRVRVGFHHSGLSYAQRAELIEPLAKSGQLRAVVATMGLAAGINFSMRSVAITGTSFLAGGFERQVQPDELLQMFGRAGRRGLDETGYALVSQQPPRLMDARPRTLKRPAQVDWPALVAVMQGAVERGADPFAAARELNERLFSTQRIPVGVEHSLETGRMPCGLWVDMERARFARRGVVEILNSRGEWQPRPPGKSEMPMGKALKWISRSSAIPLAVASPVEADAPAVILQMGETARALEFRPPPPPAREPAAPALEGRWAPALASAQTLEGIGPGNLIKLHGENGARNYGREVALGTRRGDGLLALPPWLRRVLGIARLDSAGLERTVLADLPKLTGGGRLLSLLPRGEQLFAQVAYDELPVKAWVDVHGVPLIDPPERQELPAPCREGGPCVKVSARSPCVELPWCLGAPIVSTPAYSWRRLGLIDATGRPTRRGIIFSYFQHGEGLAIAAALEDESYAIDELTWDIANLRAGPRFSGDDAPFSGRLAITCQRLYQRTDVEGYLSLGVPPDYGAGASEAIRSIVEGGVIRARLLTDSLRMGDLERALLEWRSLLRHVTYAPSYEWDRWEALKLRCTEHLAVS